MTDKKTIHEMLHEVQTKLKAPKAQRNSFGKYNFRNCEDILEGVKAVLPSGCFVTLSDDLVMVGERYYIKATASFCCGGTLVDVTAWAREAVSKKGMDDSQLTGSTSSYARKYALNGLFAIDDTKDADSHDNTGQQAKPAPKSKQAPVKPKPLTPEQQAKKLAGDIIKEISKANNTEVLQDAWKRFEDDLGVLFDASEKAHAFVCEKYHELLEGFKA